MIISFSISSFFSAPLSSFYSFILLVTLFYPQKILVTICVKQSMPSFSLDFLSTLGKIGGCLLAVVYRFVHPHHDNNNMRCTRDKRAKPIPL